MTLDEHPFESHRRLRHHESELDLDAGSEAAEEAMFLEGLARMRVEEPWRFVDSVLHVDARTFPSAGTEDVECWRHPDLPDIPWPA